MPFALGRFLVLFQLWNTSLSTTTLILLIQELNGKCRYSDLGQQLRSSLALQNQSRNQQITSMAFIFQKAKCVNHEKVISFILERMIRILEHLREKWNAIYLRQTLKKK